METKNPPFKVGVNDLRDGNANRIIHKYDAPPHVTVEDLLNPTAWSIHSYRFNVHDLIEIVWQDNSKECMLRVLDRSDQMALVALRGSVIEYDKTEVLDEDKESVFYVKFAGPQRKHEIRRKDNQELIEQGISTRAQANEKIATLNKRYGA